MPWLKVSDTFMQHDKVLRLSGNAIALWLEASCYANLHLTDGLIKPHVLAMMRFRKFAQELRDVGLWEPDQDGQGDRIHDYLDYNPPASQVLAYRAQEQARVRAYRTRTSDRTYGNGTNGVRVPGPSPVRTTPLTPPDGGEPTKTRKRRKTGSVENPWRCPHDPVCGTPSQCLLRTMKAETGPRLVATG